MGFIYTSLTLLALPERLAVGRSSVLSIRRTVAYMNLQIRMGMRRFTRLTNGHSKKIENHRHSLAIYFMYYNFARIHSTLRVTPAMEAGVSNHVWSIEEIVGLI
jgi:hypothetical protein